jgi:hypothetical protein
MLITIRRLLVPCSVLWMAGCTLCPSLDDYTYSAYGGRWQRHDMENGRVGSAFNSSGSEIIVGEEVIVGDAAPVEVSPEPNPQADLEAERPLSDSATHSVLR